MAYGAIGSLELTIDRLLKSSHISIVQNSSPQILTHLYDEILSLKEALGEFDKWRSTINMKMVRTLEAEIIHVVYKFEDVIDLHLSNQFHSQSEEEETTDHHRLMVYSIDVEEIKQDADSFIQTVNKIKGAYIHELHNPSPEEDDDVVPSRLDSHGNESNMVGLSGLFMTIKKRLNSTNPERRIVSLYGMAGIGKTTLVKKLFQYPFRVERTHLFVTIGPKYQLADILVDILTQLNANIDEIMLMEGEKVLVELKRMVFKSLRFLRYLIVLDDVWDRELCLELLELFPEDNNKSRVLLTTRLSEVALCSHSLNTFKIPFLDKKESWELLREKMFGERPCPRELEKAGKKIAENCEGLPLTIVTVANILSRADKTSEHWNKVANDKQNSTYKDAYDQMSNVLYPSYDYLPQPLKTCFLYVGAFPQNHMVDPYQLANLCSAEGFLNSKPIELDFSFTYGTHVYLAQLLVGHVIMFDAKTRTYHLHSSFWYLCNKEAAKNKLFYAVNCHADALPEEGINSQRRLCIRNNVLLAIEDVHNSIADASMVRSLLCTGYFHQYPVPLCLEHLRLLRVLHVLSVRFYEFPMEVLKLVQLRYFALVYDGNLPPSISKLLNLEYLIVERHLRIIPFVGNVSRLPIEIWNMKRLKYLHTGGRDLPHPSHEESLLPNLLQLLCVPPQSCSKHLLAKVPNLEVLVIQIDLPPYASEPLSCFDHISHLHQLQELECYITNSTLKAEVVAPLAPLSDFPSSLTKLTLSGSFGYPWEEMNKISLLPNLNSLTLQFYAFRGPEWEVRDNEFQSLIHLQIEDTDLEQLTFENCCCLPAIEVFYVADCYKLKEIPLTFGTSLQEILVLDCNPMAVSCGIKLQKEWYDKYGDGKRSLVLRPLSSWNDDQS
ncbi:PREDICTED: putative late blight resistance protein homolog R1A-10 [Erythranthe guttata]|uniref:putative late blight resistance protein homolog R1A-10 n=1 Tax=Erythranthe guttata TaxID=4155 RepID=UPI00064DE468|nr:PREDICTED: putative late blight resistance protein homolog R1A-10 [Erythranthe guttata]|eukprot:XP_012829209.1 PREDICTED: putative late blight resistance protein homolog R1A-10 [Erythranthe guttata]